MPTTQEQKKEMKDNNFLQVGQITACGHCDPERFGAGLKQAEEMGFTKCDCKCHTTQEIELEKSLREKWAKFLRSPASMANSIEEAHADWWLKEFALSHQALLKEKREEVEKLDREEITVSEHECHMYCCGRCWCEAEMNDGLIKKSVVLALLTPTEDNKI